MNNPLWYLFSKTWEYSKGNRRSVVSYWVMFVCAELVDTVLRPLIWAKMIEVVTVQGINANSMKTLYICLGLVVIRTLVSWLFHGPARCIERDNAFLVRLNFSKYLLKGVVTLPLEWHVEHHTGDTIDKVSKGTNALYEFSEDSFVPIRAIIQLIASYVVLAYFSPSAAFIVLGMILVSAWITMRFDKVLIGQYKELNKNENQVSESIIDVIQNISTIIVLRVERLVFNAIIHKIEKSFKLFSYNQRLNETKWFLTSVCCNTMIALVVGVYFLQHMNVAPGLLVANFYLLVSYLDSIGELFFRFAEMYGNIVRKRSRIGSSEELSRDFKGENFVNHVLPVDWKNLEVRDLSFSYSSNIGDPNLDNVSLTIHRGERIAFVGKTGSGKTTFLRIMRDLYHPEKLQLFVDGQFIPNGFGGISQAITLVQQCPEIFAQTIWHNVTMGAEYSMETVLRYTDMACFTEVVNNLPNRFESSINEKGVNLSGGQQQRLALSRGLLACEGKDILLLDEPTSSLDAITDALVYKNIFDGFKGKTIISTIHQLRLLPLFDRICVFDNGRIVGVGTLQELLKSCPEFVLLLGSIEVGEGS